MGQLVEVTLEIDAELKEQAEKVLAENGLTLEEDLIDQGLQLMIDRRRFRHLNVDIIDLANKKGRLPQRTEKTGCQNTRRPDTGQGRQTQEKQCPRKKVQEMGVKGIPFETDP